MTSFAQQNGLTIVSVSPNDDWVSFTTTVEHANTLFGAAFHTFTHPSTSRSIVRTFSVSLPSELVGHVDVIHPSTSFESPNMRLMPIMPVMENKRDVPLSCNSTVTPSCLQDLYGIPAAAATETSNTLLVTAYQDQFAQSADVSVSTFTRTRFKLFLRRPTELFASP